MIHEEKTQTACVLRLFGAPLWTVQQAAQQADIAARCRGRGAEVLAALQAETPAGLEKARKALNGRFAAELYGEGEMTLVHAAVQALETHRLPRWLNRMEASKATGRPPPSETTSMTSQLRSRERICRSWRVSMA